MEREQIINDWEYHVEFGKEVGLERDFINYVSINLVNSTLTLIKELTEESQKWQEAYYCADAACRELSSKCDELIEDTVHKMQAMIKEECIAGGIYPAFVARVVENVGEKLLEENDG